MNVGCGAAGHVHLLSVASRNESVCNDKTATCFARVLFNFVELSGGKHHLTSRGSAFCI